MNNYPEGVRDVLVDERNILYPNIVNPVGKIIKDLGHNFNDFEDIIEKNRMNYISKDFDSKDVNTFFEWYKKYFERFMYRISVDSPYDSKQDKDSINKKIDENKDKFDLMNVIELCVLIYQEAKYKQEGHDIRMFKASPDDDHFRKSDYIVEYYDDDLNLINVESIDLTLATNKDIIEEKKEYETASPKDYFKYKGAKLKYAGIKTPVKRKVLDLNKDIVYHFVTEYLDHVKRNKSGELVSDKIVLELFEEASEDYKDNSDSYEKAEKAVNSFKYKVDSMIKKAS